MTHAFRIESTLWQTVAESAAHGRPLASSRTWMISHAVETTIAQQVACVEAAGAYLQATWDEEFEGYALQDLRGYASRSYRDIYGVLVVEVALERYNDVAGVYTTTWLLVDVDTLAVDEVYRRCVVARRAQEEAAGAPRGLGIA